ncbi:hypothetical protein CCHR01_15369 [Colletotrichum chrysophilum]|uniref:Uncharacterized protein n=1 Tax=Colletotrichum chrysophilum TaxID=1836956 RepID=A0AAD9A6H4_9PEZI|nr:hypothetical protein K456DRAFT_35059 [Colletotrichum gloeosporioides 23]KAK1842007.1 hypothetical protein CCHR01_15369 [Colletotrichum chrysophilum]
MTGSSVDHPQQLVSDAGKEDVPTQVSAVSQTADRTCSCSCSCSFPSMVADRSFLSSSSTGLSNTRGFLTSPTPAHLTWPFFGQCTTGRSALDSFLSALGCCCSCSSQPPAAARTLHIQLHMHRIRLWEPNGSLSNVHNASFAGLAAFQAERQNRDADTDARARGPGPGHLTSAFNGQHTRTPHTYRYTHTQIEARMPRQPGKHCC